MRKTFLILSALRKKRLHYKKAYKGMIMADLLKEHTQIIIVCIISLFILYSPQLWFSAFMDFAICCWLINAILNFFKKVLNKGDSDEI